MDYADMSETERQHVRDVQSAVERAIARDAHLQTLGTRKQQRIQ